MTNQNAARPAFSAAEREQQRITHLVLRAPRPCRKITSKRKRRKHPSCWLAQYAAFFSTVGARLMTSVSARCARSSRSLRPARKMGVECFSRLGQKETEVECSSASMYAYDGTRALQRD